jgi:DNA modification methylase
MNQFELLNATSSPREQFDAYVQGNTFAPLFLRGDSAKVLAELPDNSIDFCMTSPPYWNQREYNDGGIGLEESPEEYIASLLVVFKELKRVLKEIGSFWLNIGDTYVNKSLVGLPWRIAISLIDQQGWIMRNDVVWNKIKGPDNSQDKLRNTHEYVFHFVKRSKDYYYDVNAIRSKPRESTVRNGAVVSATGVTGVRYKRQIELSTALSPEEKKNAFEALNDILAQVAKGQISDFRMVIRNQQRTTHGDSEKLSGRAKELAQKGYYFLKYHPDGSKPGDVWDIIPEDTQKRETHYAPYPEDLCKIPIFATCPQNGIVLDPFCGTGTTNSVAFDLGRKSVGIDISEKYIDISLKRCNRLL